MQSTIDITGKIGPLASLADEPEWPMFSYDRPSYVLWNAIAQTLYSNGWSAGKIREWLQSKEPRWALDGELGNQIRQLGNEWAEKHILRVE